MKVATLNIQHGARGFKNVLSDLEVLDADILFLQEVDKWVLRSLFRDQSKKALVRCGYRSYLFSSTRRLPPFVVGFYGIAAFAKDPDAHFFAHDLSIVGDKQPRHAIEVRLSDAHAPIFYGTHLSVNNAHAHTQLMHLKTIAEKEAHAWVIAGDLNLSVDEVQSIIPTYALKTKAPTFPSQDPRHRIDHIVFSQGPVETHIFGDTNSSDHLGIWADINF